VVRQFGIRDPHLSGTATSRSTFSIALAAKVGECRNSEIAATRSGKRLPPPAIYFENGSLERTVGSVRRTLNFGITKPQTDGQPRALSEYRLGGGEAGDAHEKPEHHHRRRPGDFPITERNRP